MTTSPTVIAQTDSNPIAGPFVIGFTRSATGIDITRYRCRTHLRQSIGTWAGIVMSNALRGDDTR